MQMRADEAGSQPAKMLFMIDKPQPVLGGSVAEIVPVTKGGGRETLQDAIPKIVRGNFPHAFPAFQAEPKAESRGFFPKADKNFLHPGPGLGKGLLHAPDGGDFFLHVGLGADSAGQGQSLELFRPATRAGGADMENHQGGADGGSGLESFEGVAFGEPAGGGSGIGKFVGVGVGAENLHRDRAEIVQHGDFGHPSFLPAGKNSRPKAVTGVMTQFHLGEAQIDGFPQQGMAIGDPFGMPAGGKGQRGHRSIFQERAAQSDAKAERDAEAWV